MSPCCIAAAAVTAVTTALIVVGLTAFVLVTDGIGLVVIAATTMTAMLQSLRWIGPSPGLFYGFSLVLGARAAWLLATTRRPMVIAVWRFVRPRASRALSRLWALRPPPRLQPGPSARPSEAGPPTAVFGIGTEVG